MIPEIKTLLTLTLYALPAWCLMRGLWAVLRKPRLRPLREVTLALFVCFMAGLLSMALEGAWAAPQDMLQSALERLPTMRKIHLMPFHTIGPQLQNLPSVTSVTQLLGNTLLFAPWGFFLPLLWPHFRRSGRMAGMALGLTLFIECTQLFIDRFFEVDDILLNFLGSMLGYGIWMLLHRFTHNGLDRHLLT